MRNRIRRFSLCMMLAVLMLPSCNFLQNAPEGELTLDEIFNDINLTRKWLVDVYSGIPDPYKPMLQNYDAYADDLSPSIGWNQFGWDCIDKIQGQWDANTAWNGNFWGNLPVRIRSAYIFIENAKPLPEQRLYETEVNTMKAEARFLIAYYFYLMVNTYGAIPFQNWLADFDDTYEELLIGQTPYDQVIDWIDQELVAVSKELPPTRELAAEQGRATALMALAVRARMLLFAASPLVNGNDDPDYAKFTNDKGELIFNPNYDPKKWEKAAKANKELIDMAKANGCDLYKEYNDDGTLDPFMSYSNMSFVEFPNNPEALFIRHSCDYSGWDGDSAPITYGGQNGLGITQSLVDAFFMKNGRSPILGHNRDANTVQPIFNDDSSVTALYSEKGFSTNDDKRKTKWHYGSPNGTDASGLSVVAPKGTFNMYVNREPRFYISVLFHNQYYKPSGEYMQFGAGQPNGRQERWWDSPQNGYLLRKRVHPDTDIKENIRTYRPGILFRLAEAYLSYAEALYHTDPNNPDLLYYLNEVRIRAGIPTYGSGPDQIPVPTGEALLDAIKRERRVEFNCEYAIRFDDIRRWKEIDLLAGPFDGMNAKGSVTEGTEAYNESNPNAFFVRTTYIIRGFSDKNYWFPIHQNQIDKNPNLRQLPKW